MPWELAETRTRTTSEVDSEATIKPLLVLHLSSLSLLLRAFEVQGPEVRPIEQLIFHFLLEGDLDWNARCRVILCPLVLDVITPIRISQEYITVLRLLTL